MVKQEMMNCILEMTGYEGNKKTTTRVCLIIREKKKLEGDR
jgi:hypothetical protein